MFLSYGVHVARHLAVPNCKILGATGHSVITGVTLHLYGVTGKYELPH
jgi:hypothetical protein